MPIEGDSFCLSDHKGKFRWENLFLVGFTMRQLIATSSNNGGHKNLMPMWEFELEKFQAWWYSISTPGMREMTI